MTRGNHLNLNELSELLYAIAALIAGETKEQTRTKNAKSEPAWNKRINKTAEWYGQDLN